MKKTVLSVLFIILSLSAPAFAANGLEVSAPSFLKAFNKASARVTKGLSPTQTEEGKSDAPNGDIIIARDTSIIMTLKRQKDSAKLDNISVSYFYDPEAYSSSPKDAPDASLIFSNMCLQVIFALNENIEDSKARSALRELGIHGPMLDGLQRRKVIGERVYIMKFQPNGVTIMAVSHK